MGLNKYLFGLIGSIVVHFGSYCHPQILYVRVYETLGAFLKLLVNAFLYCKVFSSHSTYSRVRGNFIRI